MAVEMKTEIGKFFAELVAYTAESDAHIVWPKGTRAINREQRLAIDPDRTRRFAALSEKGMRARGVRRKQPKSISIRRAVA